MKVTHLLAVAVAGAGLSVATPSQSPYCQVSMCVTTAIGTCGNFCQPADCQPNYTLVSSYENMLVDVAGAPDSAYVLFVGYAAPGCLAVPNIGGQLATWTVAAPITIGSFEDKDLRDDLPCSPAAKQHVVSIPNVPPGIDMRFQLLGMDNYAKVPTLSFSRPVEVRTR